MEHKLRYSGRVPYGYRHDGAIIVPVDNEVKALQEIFRIFLEGASYKSIVRELNSKKIKTQNGKTWMLGNLKSILSIDRVRFYSGFRNSFQGEWQPIITIDYAERIIAEINKRYSPTNKPKNRVSTAFSGKSLLYCGYCNSSMKISYSSQTNLYYVCRKKTDAGNCQRAVMMKTSVVDELILSHLGKIDFSTTVTDWNSVVEESAKENIESLCGLILSSGSIKEKHKLSGKLLSILESALPIDKPKHKFSVKYIEEFIESIHLTDKHIIVDCKYPVNCETKTITIRYNYAKLKIERSVR